MELSFSGLSSAGDPGFKLEYSAPDINWRIFGDENWRIFGDDNWGFFGGEDLRILRDEIRNPGGRAHYMACFGHLNACFESRKVFLENYSPLRIPDESRISGDINFAIEDKNPAAFVDFERDTLAIVEGDFREVLPDGGYAWLDFSRVKQLALLSNYFETEEMQVGISSELCTLIQTLCPRLKHLSIVGDNFSTEWPGDYWKRDLFRGPMQLLDIDEEIREVDTSDVSTIPWRWTIFGFHHLRHGAPETTAYDLYEGSRHIQQRYRDWIAEQPLNWKPFKLSIALLAWEAIEPQNFEICWAVPAKPWVQDAVYYVRKPSKPVSLLFLDYLGCWVLKNEKGSLISKYDGIEELFEEDEQKRRQLSRICKLYTFF